MTYYPDLGFSDCQVASAVAEAALHDLRVNNFTFPGFPQIDACDDPNGSFTITMRWNKASSVQFQLSHTEVKYAVKRFKAGTGHDPAIFKKVQEALVDLETQASRYPTI